MSLQLKRYYDCRAESSPALKLHLCVAQQDEKTYNTEPLVSLRIIVELWNLIFKYIQKILTKFC